ncbi:MAG: hydantoinase/oxoprolinase family protein [Patulibacter sp.]
MSATEAPAPQISPGKVRAAVDVGGTFTDVYILGADGQAHVAKTPSTPANPIDGLLKGVELAGVEWKDVELFAHGTTIATNALITRRLPDAAVVTTEGFRDVIEIGRGTREDPWDAYKESPKPYIRRRDRLVVKERVSYDGKVLEPLDEAGARDVARILGRRGVKTVAVCFVNAYANGDHENRMKEILEEELPGVVVTTSHDVHPEIFEHERFSTTVANAVLSPIVRPYAQELGTRLKDDGYAGDVLLLHSGGGVMTTAVAEQYAARLAASGIAAGAIASQHVARLSGFDNSIGFDMGGTSTDVSLSEGGNLRMTDEWFVEYGLPICFPSIEVLTIGAGGGSLAWLDDAGALRNGPQSAGSVPGPACYGTGSGLATNTDANLILGRVGTQLVGGGMSLDRDASIEAMGEIAAPLGLSVEEAALATLRVACANMADAVRLISIRRGHDPRDFALVAFGGAGPLHGVAVAKELSIPTVIIPASPGVTSAMGCLLVDIQHDVKRMFLRGAGDVEPTEIEAAFRELEEEGRERLTHEGVAEQDMTFQRMIDMRYQGQWRSISVSVGQQIESIDDAIATFHADYQREHNFSRTGLPVEIYRLGVRAIGLTPKPASPPAELVDGAVAEPAGTRMVRFDELPAAVETPLFDRDALVAGTVITGPAIITQLDSTTLVPPGTTASVDAWLNIRIDIEEQA